MGGLGGRKLCVGVAVVFLAVWVRVAAPSSAPTPEIKTEAPPPPPGALITPRDCPLYVHGELQEVKKHGETWLIDGSACEMCKCQNGRKRCYFHYCNMGLTEGFMTAPSERPPQEQDDEDFSDLLEGSGYPPPPPPHDYYKFLHHLQDTASKGGEKEKEKDQRENETHYPVSADFCSHPCKKTCPHGYKVDEVHGCRRCKCHKCGSMHSCQLQCPGGLALDHHGCRTCRCQSPKLALITSADDDFIVDENMAGEVYITGTHADQPCNTSRVGECMDAGRVYPVGSRWGHGACVSCSCVAPGYTQCNITQCQPMSCPTQQQLQHFPDQCCPSCTDVDEHETRWEEIEDPDQLPHHRVTGTHSWAPTTMPEDPSRHQAANDGTTKSAVQASSVEAWQVCVVLIPLVLVFLLVSCLVLHYWRRNHRDKYDINAYRPPDITDQLHPVKTPDHLHPVRHV